MTKTVDSIAIQPKISIATNNHNTHSYSYGNKINTGNFKSKHSKQSGQSSKVANQKNKIITQTPIATLNLSPSTTAPTITTLKREEKKADNININTNTNTKEKRKQDKLEEITFKTISKQEANKYCAQMANFCKLWANVEGCSVADGDEKGGLFLRNVSKLFKDKKFISKHGWNDIILKIREYTKLDASLIGLFNFTQLVEDEGTLERPIKFGENRYDTYPLSNNEYAYSNSIDNISMMFNGQKSETVPISKTVSLENFSKTVTNTYTKTATNVTLTNVNTDWIFVNGDQANIYD